MDLPMHSPITSLATFAITEALLLLQQEVTFEKQPLRCACNSVQPSQRPCIPKLPVCPVIPRFRLAHACSPSNALQINFHFVVDTWQALGMVLSPELHVLLLVVDVPELLLSVVRMRIQTFHAA